MTTTEPPTSSAYQRIPDTYDEMAGPNGVVRQHWSHLAQILATLGPQDLVTRQREAVRLLDEDGVTYNPYGAAPRVDNRWGLDPVPVPVSSQEWTELESGVIERADLLNLVLADLYGPRELLRRGVIPPEVIFSDAGFLRPCDQIRLPGTQQLFTYACDLARDAGGRSLVLADRTEAPSGFGYAVENRRVVSRVFPSLYRDAQVHRLAPFFRSLRVALQGIAPPQVDDPRIVVLTPGPWSETAFEHAFLASYLGYSLVEGSDLTVRDGRVWLRSLGRLEPVHVILRRVDGWYCDPLELQADSKLGVPGLVEATRLGTVSVVNKLGSTVLQNPALMAFLPRIGEYFLGRPLRLPSVPTWWCGDDQARRHVLANLGGLVIKPTTRHIGANSRFGWELSAAERSDLRAQIEASPGEWVGQEPVPMATVPTLTEEGLQPRRSVLRVFAVARDDSYAVMPGGLTRVAATADTSRISNQAGAISKDTWVLASEPERLTGFWLQPGPAVEAADPMAAISARAAENLFWMGRYAERAEDVARLLRVVYERRSDFQGSANPAGVQAFRALLAALTSVTTTYPGFIGEEAPARLRSPGQELFALVVDDQRVGSLAHSFRRLLDAAYAVRDHLSTDTWLVVGVLDREILALKASTGPRSDPQAAVHGALQRVMQSLLALAGLGAESMVRDPGWRFMDAGRRIERSIQLLAFLQATLIQVRDTATDSLMLESVLIATESIITYRRRYRSHAQLETVLDLLLVDPINPRSLAYQLDRLGEAIDAMPPAARGVLRDEQKLVIEASTTLRLADTASLVGTDDEGRRGDLELFLGHLLHLLSGAADAMDRAHFTHLLPQSSVLDADGEQAS